MSGRERVLDRLATGRVEVLGILPYASNYTYLARVEASATDVVLAVYKPRRGERRLWDFEHGTLAAREAAAFVVSEAGGFDLVPPTVLRDDLPLGAGSLQLFVEHDPHRHYFVLIDERRQDFEAIAAFDVVINNADRKAGHVLEDSQGKLWAVDHGVCFHTDPKLRTVIWEFAERPLSEGVRVKLERLAAWFDQDMDEGLIELLTQREIDATRARVAALLHEGLLPAPYGHYPLPWPLV